MNSFISMAGGTPSRQNLEVVKQQVFDFDYPLTDEVKESFEKKFIKYFLYREFGFNNFFRFQLSLENYLLEKAPVFNQLHAAYSELNPYKTNRQTTSNDSTSLSLGVNDVKGDSVTDSATVSDNYSDNVTDNSNTSDNIATQDSVAVNKDSGSTTDTSDTIAAENSFADVETTSEGESGTLNVTDSQRLTKDLTETESHTDSNNFSVNDTTNGAQKVSAENAKAGTQQTVVEHEGRAANMETENTGKQKNTVGAQSIINYEYPTSTTLPETGGTTGQRLGEHTDVTEYDNHKTITRPALGDAGKETSKDTTNVKYLDGYKDGTTTTTDPNSVNNVTAGGNTDDSNGKSETTGTGGESNVSDTTTVDKKEDLNKTTTGNDSVNTTTSAGTSKNESDTVNDSTNVSSATTKDNGFSSTLSGDNSLNNTTNKNNQNTTNAQDTAQSAVTITEGNTAALVEMYKAYLEAVTNLEYELIKDADDLFFQVGRW